MTDMIDMIDMTDTIEADTTGIVDNSTHIHKKQNEPCIAGFFFMWLLIP
jgi:hypothetical protein